MGNDFYTITGAASEEPVTLNDVLAFCRIDQNSPDESLVKLLITAAIEQCENYTNRVFVERTFLGQFDCIQTSRFERFAFIELRRGPFKSLTSITLEIDGSPVAVTGVLTKNSATYARLLFSETLSSSDDDVAYPLQVAFVAGYGAAAVVPEDIKTAIKQTVLFWYENRGDVVPDGKQRLPGVATMILHKYRIVNTFG